MLKLRSVQQNEESTIYKSLPEMPHILVRSRNRNETLAERRKAWRQYGMYKLANNIAYPCIDDKLNP